MQIKCLRCYAPVQQLNEFCKSIWLLICAVLNLTFPLVIKTFAVFGEESLFHTTLPPLFAAGVCAGYLPAFSGASALQTLTHTRVCARRRSHHTNLTPFCQRLSTQRSPRPARVRGKRRLGFCCAFFVENSWLRVTRTPETRQ